MEFETPLAGALYMYDRGFKLFPCVKDGKEPMFKGWQKWAEECTEAGIKAMGDQCNWGIYCGASGVTVVDLDVKRKDKNGFESWKALQEEHGVKFKPTLTAETPSKGLHLYYKGVHRTSAGALGPGIDTRSAGGYVLCPGAQVKKIAYSLTQDAPILPLPTLIAKILDEQKAKVLDENELILEGERNDTLASLAGSMRARGMGADAIYAALSIVNEQQLEIPLDDSEVRTIANSVSRYSPEHAQAASDFLELPSIRIANASQIDPAKIRPRNWFMDGRYIGGFISVIVSPGGIGKSILTMLDAIALATGKDLTGFNVKLPVGVWIYNTEDPMDELKRRLVALTMQHQIAPSELKELHISSGRESPLIMAKQGRDGIVLNKNALSGIIDTIRARKIKVMLVDPFVRTHEVSENDNMQIDKVVWCFQRVANQTGCAVGIVHHTRKLGAANGNGAASAELARGASALINAARVAHVLQTMSGGEAKRFGIPEAEKGWYMRLDNAKANLQPPADHAHWFRKVNINLINGDIVGAISRVELRDKALELEAEELEADARDIARALCQRVREGNRMPVIDAYTAIAGANPHIFNVSAKRGQERLIRALQSGNCSYGGRRFIYQYEDGPKRSARHFCFSEQLNLSDNDFLE